MTRTRLSGDAGSGVVSSLAGVAAFLACLFLAVHVVVGLYATAVVTDAAATAARRVAGADAAEDPAAEVEAEEALRAALGRLGDAAAVSWRVDDDSVAVTVRVPRPGFLHTFGADIIQRTVTVRREVLR